MKYNPKLDGLRALCILGVMLCHWRIVDAGWIGVQCFFVLSGYLISGILLDYKERFSAADYFKVFYYRRALRIFPLYFAWVIGLGLGWIGWKVPASFLNVQLYLYTYTINFARTLPGYPDYAHNELYSHLWSLAVEEQFYFVWPLALFLIPRVKLNVVIRSCIVAAPLLRLATGLAFSQVYQAPHLIGEGVYNLPTSHLDAFACGAAVAIGLPELTRNAVFKLRCCLSFTILLGVGMLCLPQVHQVSDLSSLGYPSALPAYYQYVWGYSIINLTAALWIATLAQSTSARSLLQWQPLLLVGRISYGVYLFHWPIQMLFREWFPHRSYAPASLLGFLLSSVVTIFVAYLSFTWFESWFLRRKDGLALPPARLTEMSVSLTHLRAETLGKQPLMAEEKQANDISL
jgi:peptidoglycan/LPS O-acetylase OafA/YrhL